MKKIPELLAPAGSFESLDAALQAKADAVYFGIGGLNMRASAAKNFQLDDLPKIAQKCHKNNVRAYLALNTIVYDNEFDRVYEIIDAAKEAQIDAIIAADMAVLQYARKKDMELHISTQVSVSNIQSLKFYSQFADRFVLARELDIDQLNHISEQIQEQQIKGPSGNLVQIEAFAHGALCVAVSGRCAMSLYCYDKSANRGQCTQVCRRAYKVTDLQTGQELKVDNNFVMSPSDICTVGMLPELVQTGVDVLKIEGRGRTPDYVYTVVKTYREALEAIKNDTYTNEKVKKWNKKLGTVFNRGFSTGLYMGRKADEWAKGAGNKASKKRMQIGRVDHYYDNLGVAVVKIESDEVLKEGEEYNILGDNTGFVHGYVQNMRVDDVEVKKAVQGDLVSFEVPMKVRKNDKFFVIRDNN